MATPNSALRATRMGLLMSQDDFARALREAGRRAGEPNDASKRLVQRWEAGISLSPRPAYARALETITGLPIEALGFAPAVPQARVSDAGKGGYDLENSATGIAAAHGMPAAQPALRGNRSGIWLSRYEYVSSSRGNQVFTGLHYVVIL